LVKLFNMILKKFNEGLRILLIFHKVLKKVKIYLGVCSIRWKRFLILMSIVEKICMKRKIAYLAMLQTDLELIQTQDQLYGVKIHLMTEQVCQEWLKCLASLKIICHQEKMMF